MNVVQTGLSQGADAASQWHESVFHSLQIAARRGHPVRVRMININLRVVLQVFVLVLVLYQVRSRIMTCMTSLSWPAFGLKSSLHSIRTSAMVNGRGIALCAVSCRVLVRPEIACQVCSMLKPLHLSWVRPKQVMQPVGLNLVYPDPQPAADPSRCPRSTARRGVSSRCSSARRCCT